ncbi:MAG: hypothetical protein HOW73_24410 [Polyangiaceae bacterium]|nr:hypothetical protein [Polyangiaceae bacterium]
MRASHHVSILTATVVLGACVEIIDDPTPQGGGGAGAGGTASATGGSDQGAGGVGGAGGFGGLGGSGGSEPGVVEGCEKLEWAGEPIVVPASGSREVHLVRLEDGQVGVVYVDNTLQDPGEVVASFTIDDPFGAWPPAFSAPVEHVVDQFYNNPGLLSARPDGTVAMSGGAHALFTLGQPDLMRRLDGGATPLVAPTPDGGFYETHANFDTNELEIEHYATIDQAEGNPLEALPVDSACLTVRAAPHGADLLVAAASAYYCDDGVHTTTILRLSPSGFVTTAAFDIPAWAVKQRLLSHSGGGYWYGVVSEDGTPRLVAYPLDAAGTLAGDPWLVESEDERYVRDLTSWRDGIAFAYNDYMSMGVAVFDGKNRSYVDVPDPGVFTGSRNYAPMLSGGPDERSILLAYASLEGIRVRRADCVAAR